uniref:flagellar FliJ family protein n=1 Tax=Bacillus velezensis TaxID=492670 RepID=UPI00201BB2A0
IQARATIHWHEEKLLAKNLKVRKFEKMREKDLKLFQQEQDRIESIFLDEISLQTYNKREIRRFHGKKRQSIYSGVSS